MEKVQFWRGAWRQKDIRKQLNFRREDDIPNSIFVFKSEESKDRR